MVDKVDPVVGRTALSDFHRNLHVDASGNLKNWIPSGFTPTDGGGLNLSVAAGRAYLAGATADRNVSTLLALTDASTNHVWVYIDDGLDDGVVYFLVNTTGVAPTQGPYHKLATVTTAGGGITLITDLRLLIPELSGALTLNGLLKVVGADVEADRLVTNLSKILSAAEVQIRNGADTAYLNLIANLLKTTGGKILTDASEMAIRNIADSAYKDLHILDLIVDGLVDGVNVADHDARHEPGGADPMAVDAAVATGSLRTIGGGALQAKAGNAAPLAHVSSHQPGGSDEILQAFFPIFNNAAAGDTPAFETSSTSFVDANYAMNLFGFPSSFNGKIRLTLGCLSSGETITVELHDGTVSKGSGSWSSVGNLWFPVEFTVTSVINTGFVKLRIKGSVGFEVRIAVGTAEIFKS